MRTSLDAEINHGIMGAKRGRVRVSADVERVEVEQVKKNSVGRPFGACMRWDNAENMEKDFLEYLRTVEAEGKVPNIAGFCIHARISRQTFYDYAERAEFKQAVKLINLTLEEKALQVGFETKNQAFAIFYLKNKFGWQDKIEYSGEVRNTVSVDLQGLDDSALVQRLQALKGLTGSGDSGDDSEVIDITDYSDAGDTGDDSD